jgi:anti-sigma regulatory factor (Ser/Thr protein kinase)
MSLGQRRRAGTPSCARVRLLGAPATWLSTAVPAAPASFEPEPASVGAARRYALGLLQAPTVRHLQDDVRTVVSELATNAVLHARTPFTVAVHVDVAGVRVAVTDASPTRPRLPRRGDLTGTTGRGLRIVALLSADWGVEVHDDGKTTWCLLPATTPSGLDRGPHDDTETAGPAPVADRAADARRSLPDGRDGASRGVACSTSGFRPDARAVAA